VGEVLQYIEAAGFTDIETAPVPGFSFRKASTNKEAAVFGVKAMLITARKP